MSISTFGDDEDDDLAMGTADYRHPRLPHYHPIIVTVPADATREELTIAGVIAARRAIQAERR